MKKSRALLITKEKELTFDELEIPEVGDYEVLFHTQAVSLCTVDRRTYLGTRKHKMPFLGGHECSGVVEKVGKGVVEVQPGDHVIFTGAYCMQCELDRTGRGTQCKNKQKMPKRVCLDEGMILGGGLSEYLVIPAWQVIKYPETTSYEHAAMTEPLACSVHSIRKANIQLGETVVIIGLGIMGYFHLKLAQMQGARVIVSETNEERINKALEEGAWQVINPLKENLTETVQSLTNGLGADVIVNTIPSSGVWQSAIDTLAPYGRLIAYSSQDSKEKIGVDFGMVHSKEIQIIGTLNPTLHDNDTAIKLISYGLIDVSKVIDEVYPFEQGKEAFYKALEPGMYRVVVSYDGKEVN